MTPKDRLLAITPETSDGQVATLLALKLAYYNKTEVYRFRINHDISPPKCLACPVSYDWSVKGYVGIENKNRIFAVGWLTAAAIAGYSIQEVDAKRKPLLGEWIESIANARMRAVYFSKDPDHDDSDIPF